MGELDGRLVGLGWDHQFLGFGFQRLYMLCGFVQLGHWGLLRGYHDSRCRLCNLAFLNGGCHFFLHRVSVTGSGVGWGMAGRVALSTQPPRTMWFQPGTRLSCSLDAYTSFAFRAVGGLCAPPPLLHSARAYLASAPLASFHFTLHW